MLKKMLNLFGIYPKKTLRSLSGMPKYLENFIKFKRMNKKKGKSIEVKGLYPCLDDYDQKAGRLGQYFHQDLYVAQKIHDKSPKKHLDIGSRIDGFVSCVASFRKIEVFDIRKMDTNKENITFVQKDITKGSRIPKNYCDSLSCLHTLEHIGLGRYGDEIDPEGHLAAMKNMKKALKDGGKMYVSFPVGMLRIEFNAHRVFSIEYALDHLTEGLTLDELSIVDSEGISTDVNPNIILDNINRGYKTAILEMTNKNCH